MSMSDDDLDLLAAGYTAILGFKVVNPRRRDESLTTRLESALSIHGGGQRPTISIHEMFHTAQHSIFPMVSHLPSSTVLESFKGGSDEDSIYDLNVKIINGGTTTIQARKDYLARDIKAIIEEKLDIPFKNQMLMIGGQQFDDSQTLSMLVPTPPPKPSGYARPVINCVGGGDCPYDLDCSDLDPQYNYDFTNKVDDGKDYVRGGHVYKRPYGWKRYAVKVKDRYGDNTWLGEDGIRTGSTTGEWPVSYHGTKRGVINKIIEEGYKIGPRQRFGPGVYTSPSLKFCEDDYCRKFKYKGNVWKVALQNRVNPAKDHFIIIPPSETKRGVEFWVSPMQNPSEEVYDVRPYGVLFKKVD